MFRHLFCVTQAYAQGDFGIPRYGLDVSDGLIDGVHESVRVPSEICASSGTLRLCKSLSIIGEKGFCSKDLHAVPSPHHRFPSADLASADMIIL